MNTFRLPSATRGYVEESGGEAGGQGGWQVEGGLGEKEGGEGTNGNIPPWDGFGALNPSHNCLSEAVNLPGLHREGTRSGDTHPVPTAALREKDPNKASVVTDIPLSYIV